MKNRIWISLIIVAACAVPTFGQTVDATEDNDGGPAQEMRCLDCEGSGDVWAGSSSYDEGLYLDNPCTAVQDLVWVSYTAYAKGVQTAAGVERYQLSENTSVSGAYATSGAGSSDVSYAATFSQRMYHKVNTSDNFHVVTVVTMKPATKTMTLSVETACGNGRPDSPQ